MRFSDRQSWNLLLTVTAVYCLWMGLSGSLVGMFVGPHILIGGLIHLAVGVGLGIWRVKRGST
jgi:hypothetical protein